MEEDGGSGVGDEGFREGRLKSGRRLEDGGHRAVVVALRCRARFFGGGFG